MQPIFVVGLMPRCGSHFLASLLCQHPACRKSVLAEDVTLPNAGRLAQFVEQNGTGWRHTMGESHLGDAALLYRCLGDGLLAFLAQTRARYDQARAEQFQVTPNPPTCLVSKTPSVHNIRYFFQLFPDAHLLLLVRDGRAVVESTVRSFGGERVALMQQWANYARELLCFLHDPTNSGKAYRLVRYEDLYTHTETEMRAILAFLGLDAACYDFEAARNLPVIGSSTFKRGTGKVHWLPVQKSADFDPLARAADWDAALHEQFQTIAGAELAQLGYK